MDNIGFGLWMTGMGMSIVFSMLALLMGLLALMGRMDRTKAPAIEAGKEDELSGSSGVILPLAGHPSPTGGEDRVEGDGNPDCAVMTKDSDTDPTSGRKMVTGMTASGPTPELLAAITMAVLTHVRVRRGQAAPEMRQVQPGSRLFASRWVAVGRAYQNKPWK